MSKVSKALAVVALIFSAVYAEPISCPNLICADLDTSGPLTYDLCYQADYQQPLEILRSYGCSAYQNLEKSNYEISVTTVCDISLLTNEFVWVDETK